jgi:hypothetical protein
LTSTWMMWRPTSVAASADQGSRGRAGAARAGGGVARPTRRRRGTVSGLRRSGEPRQSRSCYGWRRRCAACGKKATDGIRTEAADSAQPVARAGRTVFCTYEALPLVFFLTDDGFFTYHDFLTITSSNRIIRDLFF